MSNIDRRDFLKLVGAGSVGAGAGFMLAESTLRATKNADMARQIHEFGDGFGESLGLQ